MKKSFRKLRIFLNCFLLVAFTVISFSSCSKENEDKPKSYLVVDNIKYDLSYGAIDKQNTIYGNDGRVDGRRYRLEFRNSVGRNAPHFIQFALISPSTERLQEARYSFTNTTADPGELYLANGGFGLVYDNEGMPIEGTFFDSGRNTTGSLTVSKRGDDYEFKFDFTYTVGGVERKVSGYFTDILHEENIY